MTIKEANSVAVIDGKNATQYSTSNQPDPARNFTVRLDFNRLLDPGRSPTYRIDPMTEPINVTITNFAAFLNKETDPSTNFATLKSVTFWKGAGASSIPFAYGEVNEELYALRIDDESNLSLRPNKQVTSSISFVLKPAATSLFALDEHSILDIRFNFEDDDYPHTKIKGVHYYDYNPDSVTIPALKPAVLEVAIW